MPNLEHEQHLREGVQHWNQWRQANPSLSPDLRNLDWQDAVFESADLSNVNLCGARLCGARLWNCDFRDTDLNGADLEFSYLADGNFERATLRDASLDSSNLAFANFRNADLTHANLSGTTLEDTIFCGANLTGASFACTIVIERYTKFCDDGFLNPAILSHANFKDARISSSDGFDGWLELLGCEGLETAIFDEEDFVTKYLHGALDFLTSQSATLDVESIRRAKALLGLYPREDTVPKLFVEIRRAIVAEILKLQQQPKRLYSISSEDFEKVIAEILQSFGWQVELTKRTRDGGYDIFGVFADVSGVRSSWIVECKRYAADNKIGVDIVRNLYGVKRVLEGGANALLATTSFFTKDAMTYKASRYDLEFCDYVGVVGWLNEYKPNPGGSILIRENRLILPSSKHVVPGELKMK